MPEKDSWDELRKRLQNYSEEPDDNWEKISSALSSTQVKSTAAKYWFASIVVGLISLLIPFTLMDYQTGRATKQDSIPNSTITANVEVEKPQVIKATEKESNTQRSIESTNINATKETHATKIDRPKENSIALRSNESNDAPPEMTESLIVLNEIVPTVNTKPVLSMETNSDSISHGSVISKKAIDSVKKVAAPIIVKEKKNSSVKYYASVTPVLNYYSITSEQ
jgi:hypothetical protein